MSASISVCPVIMAGGSGTRLWPMSRAGYPKQFLVLSGTTSLFQQAAARLVGLADADITVGKPLIVGNMEHRFMALDQLRELGFEPTLVLEPEGRNTAPALTLAALQAREGGADPVLVVTPADQTVADEAAFSAALRTAVREAAQGRIVILGITPDRPETGYGYIRSAQAGDGVAQVAAFVEKPDAATAAKYLASGDYSWNSGMFVLKASVWLAALEEFRPDILAATQAAWAQRSSDAQFVRPGGDAFKAVPSESVDYAVMERCPGSRFDIRMVALDAGWNDLGAWDSVWMAAAKDADGNAAHGDVLMEGSRNTLVHANSRLVTTLGVEDVIVVETADAVLVADCKRSQDVKKIVNRISGGGRSEHALHRKVYHPWGWWDAIDSGPGFQVKRLLVKPGATLSLPARQHSTAQWVVVSGSGEVSVGGTAAGLSAAETVHIPQGAPHRLANPGKVDLEIIEVQVGSQPGDDNAVRREGADNGT